MKNHYPSLTASNRSCLRARAGQWLYNDELSAGEPIKTCSTCSHLVSFVFQARRVVYTAKLQLSTDAGRWEQLQNFARLSPADFVKTYPRANAQGQSVIVGSQWLSRNFICNGNSAYFWRKPVYTYFSGRIRVCSLDRWVSSLYASFDMLKQCVEMCMAYFSSKRKTRKTQST